MSYYHPERMIIPQTNFEEARFFKNKPNAFFFLFLAIGGSLFLLCELYLFSETSQVNCG